jgi:signal transduction histidine kinase
MTSIVALALMAAMLWSVFAYYRDGDIRGAKRVGRAALGLDEGLREFEREARLKGRLSALESGDLRLKSAVPEGYRFRDGNLYYAVPSGGGSLLCRLGGDQIASLSRGTGATVVLVAQGGAPGAGPSGTYGEGAARQLFYHAYRPLPGPAGSPAAAYLGVLVPRAAVVDGLSGVMLGQLVILVLLCGLAWIWAWKIARHFLDPLSHAVTRVEALLRQVGPGGVRTREAPSLPYAGSDRELQVLHDAVDQLEKAVRRGQEDASALEAERAASVFSAKMASLGEMAAGVAHEINTPLALIAVKAGQAEEVLREPEPDRELLAKLNHSIIATVGRIARIVRSMRSFARDASKDEMRSVGVAELFLEVQSLCAERFKLHGVTLNTAIAEHELRFACRANEVMQVLLNLLNNAFDAVQGRAEKRIRMSAEARRGFIEFRVEDSGAGVPAEFRHKVFEPFYTSKEPGKGTGLGLSISRSIAQGHGGSLEVEDGPPSCFLLKLPLHHAWSPP